jgi:hypothetical protein
VRAFQKWLRGQTGGRDLRLDTYKGKPDITFSRLTKTDAQMNVSPSAFLRDRIEVELQAAGFNAPNKLYAIYYDGTNNQSCGGGAWPPALPGNVAALYLLGVVEGSPPCNSNKLGASEDTMGYWEYAMFHEIMHTLGFVATCAPNHTMAGHVSDSPTDLMYAGSQPWKPSILDLNHNDYYKNNNAGCLDFDKSPYLKRP